MSTNDMNHKIITIPVVHADVNVNKNNKNSIFTKFSYLEKYHISFQKSKIYITITCAGIWIMKTIRSQYYKTVKFCLNTKFYFG